jgi:hypothetical protein
VPYVGVLNRRLGLLESVGDGRLDGVRGEQLRIDGLQYSPLPDFRCRISVDSRPVPS